MYAGFILCIQGDNKNSSTPTWRANATYEEVVQSFFVSDLTDLETDLITEKKFVSLTTESIFKVPFGFCKSIRKVKFDNPIFLGTCKDFSITIVDSSQSTPLGLFDFPKEVSREVPPVEALRIHIMIYLLIFMMIIFMRV